LTIGALALAVVGLLATQAFRSSTTSPASAATASAAPVVDPAAAAAASASAAAAADPSKQSGATSWMPNVDLPPAWVERPFVLDGADVFIVGRGDLAATPELALNGARNDAIVRMVKQMQQDIVGTPVHDFVQARVHDDHAASEAIAARFLKQFGTTSSPERVDAALRKRDSGVEGFARYKLSKVVYQSLLTSYKETQNVQGMVVARFFPLLETALHTDGDLVVLSVQKGRPAEAQNVRAGDIVLSVDGRPTLTLDALNKISNEEWNNTPNRGQMSIDLESGGAKRSMKIFKPAPPGAPGP
jgi:hypothetical protein